MRACRPLRRRPAPPAWLRLMLRCCRRACASCRRRCAAQVTGPCCQPAACTFDSADAQYCLAALAGRHCLAASVHPSLLCTTSAVLPPLTTLQNDLMQRELDHMSELASRQEQQLK